MIKHPYVPTSVQKEIHQSPRRFKIGVFGRRSGKSTCGLNEAIAVCMEKKNAKVWIVTPTYGQGKDIYWRGNDMISKYILPEMVKKKNESELSIEFVNGSLLQIKGSDRPETLRGSGLDFILCDEVAEWRYTRETFEEILMPTLSDKNGKILLIGTPKGFNFFYEIYNQALTSEDWQAWQVPTWKSGAPWTLTPEGKKELKRIKEQYTEDVYMQEWGADFRRYTGLIYKAFDRSIHVKEFYPSKTFKFENGIDFGFRNPTAHLWTYFDNDDNWFVLDEHYMAQKTIEYHAEMIIAKTQSYPNQVTYTVADSAGTQEIAEYSNLGLFLSPVKKTDKGVITGINKVQERLKVNTGTKEPSIFIHPQCEKLIYELERYKWAEKRGQQDVNKDEVPEKVNDHACDALRYIAMHHDLRKESLESDGDWNFSKRYKPHGGEY